MSRSRRSQRGGALLIAVIATFVLAGMGAAMMVVSGSSQGESQASVERMRALYVAEAGLSEAILDLNRNGADGKVWGGTAKKWGAGGGTGFSSGGHWGEMEINADGTVTVISSGLSHGELRAVEAVVTPPVGGVYSNALFAGNSSGDPNYDLRLGGVALQGDAIDGDIYSGGNIVLNDDATITGTARASGTISGGGAGDEAGVSQPIPDIAAMDYENNHDFDVAALFAGASWAWDEHGGSAWQCVESNPAHIFRKNPSDRAAFTGATTKDDFFLEDPYELASTSKIIDAAGASPITLSGIGGKPGPNGNEAVYYVDGNLWLHNSPVLSFTIDNPEPIRVTFVVKGNIYFCDNIIYKDPAQDGIAFVAIKDPNEADSGNVYFGDPQGGTIEWMDSFIYAENNFYDTNLSAAGSALVTVNGNMSAGNQIKINRDFDGGQHSKLTVNLDDRVSDGSLSLPGLPTSKGFNYWQVVSWREVPAQ